MTIVSICCSVFQCSVIANILHSWWLLRRSSVRFMLVPSDCAFWCMALRMFPLLVLRPLLGFWYNDADVLFTAVRWRTDAIILFAFFGSTLSMGIVRGYCITSLFGSIRKFNFSPWENLPTETHPFGPKCFAVHYFLQYIVSTTRKHLVLPIFTSNSSTINSQSAISGLVSKYCFTWSSVTFSFTLEIKNQTIFGVPSKPLSLSLYTLFSTHLTFLILLQLCSPYVLALPSNAILRHGWLWVS